MQRLLIFTLLILAAYYLVKKIGRAWFPPAGGTESEKPPIDAELIQDPQCGAYFLKQRGVKGVVEGQVIHFCSEECYDKYRREHPSS